MANKIPYLVDKNKTKVYALRKSIFGGLEMVGMILYIEIQKLKKLGYKKQRAARQLNIDTKTVRKYWNMSENEYADYVIQTRERTKIMDKYHDYVLDKIKTYPEITAAIIYDNLREDFVDFAPSYRSVRLYVCNLREKEGIPAPIKIRQYGENPELPFGYQAQVDMGQKTMKDENGNSLKVYVFAMVLTSSRYKYACFQTEPFTTKTFVEAHDKAFKYFGGRPCEIVYDQDRVMVVSENCGDIIFTQEFENYKNYAGFCVHLCRGYDPESKGKIESVVKYIKNNFLSCRIYHGIARLNSDGLSWLDRTGNGLVHETTKMIPKVVFTEEQKHLKSVPALSEPLIPKTAVVRKNNMVYYRQNRYAMPKGTYLPGKKVRIEVCNENISFFDCDNNVLLEQYKIPTGIGKCIKNNHSERDKSAKLEEIKNEVLSDLDNTAEKFVEQIWNLMPRYIRDQLCLIRKLKPEYTVDEINKAIKYCTERHLYSANYLKDTLAYLSQEQDIPYVSSNDIPLKYRVVTAVTRPLSAYSDIYAGGDNR